VLKWPRYYSKFVWAVFFGSRKLGRKGLSFRNRANQKKCFKKEIVQLEENFGRLPNVELVTQQSWGWQYCNIDMVNSDVDVEGEDFFLKIFVPKMFPSSFQWVPKMFPKFPMCYPRVFPIAPRFNPICFAQSPPLLTCIPWEWGHKWTEPIAKGSPKFHSG